MHVCKHMQITKVRFLLGCGNQNEQADKAVLECAEILQKRCSDESVVDSLVQ